MLLVEGNASSSLNLAQFGMQATKPGAVRTKWQPDVVASPAGSMAWHRRLQLNIVERTQSPWHRRQSFLESDLGSGQAAKGDAGEPFDIGNAHLK